MNELDDPKIYAADPDDFLGVVEELPDQVRQGWRLGLGAEGIEPAEVSNVCVLGMGGSGVSGDVLRAVLGPKMRVPVAVSKGYTLPSWVSSGSLVLAVSYSGNTEETLATFDAAVKLGARIVCVTTGGALAQRAAQEGVPLIQIPGGLQPRAALGFLAMPLLAIVQRMGLCPPIDADVEDALQLLGTRSDQMHRKVPTSDNQAKQLATTLLGKLPIVYGSEGIAEVAAYRWKCQFNECAKIPSWWHSFPELNHNEIVGWDQLQPLTSESCAAVVLRHPGEHPRTSKRVQITTGLIEANVASMTPVRTEGRSDLAAFLDLVQVGDFTATYLALLQGVDPTPVDVITHLKDELAKS